MDVLGWVRGRAVDSERLRNLSGRVQFLQTVNPYGFSASNASTSMRNRGCPGNSSRYGSMKGNCGSNIVRRSCKLADYLVLILAHFMSPGL